jgi:hypothetical protein
MELVIQKKISPLATNLLCVLEQVSIIKIKKDSKKFESLKKEFEFLANKNNELRIYYSLDGSEMVVALNFKNPVRSFIA